MAYMQNLTSGHLIKTDKKNTLKRNTYHRYCCFWQKHDSNSAVLHAWSSVSNLFYYYFLLFRSYESFSRTKKNPKPTI